MRGNVRGNKGCANEIMAQSSPAEGLFNIRANLRHAFQMSKFSAHDNLKQLITIPALQAALFKRLS